MKFSGKKASLLALSGLGLALAVPAAPAAAAPSVTTVAAGPSAAPAAGYSTSCATGRIESIAANLPIREYPFIDATLITTAQKGYQYNCVQGYYALGDRYTACGVSGANGWLLIDFGSQIGYAYMTCLKDV
ncbi:hypothetical protein [Micromonospora avicenniae]|uniref:hypothetical protein n=1 Tax=Micromonospora avicenniae TaxID=1198245 RepID=UPI0033271FB5